MIIAMGTWTLSRAQPSDLLHLWFFCKMLIDQIELSGGRSCLQLLFSWWLWMMPLHWLPFRLRLIMVSPSFVTCDDPGLKGLPLCIRTLQPFRTDGFPLTSVLGRETSRNPSCAYLRISQSVNNCHCTSIAWLKAVRPIADLWCADPHE